MPFDRAAARLALAGAAGQHSGRQLGRQGLRISGTDGGCTHDRHGRFCSQCGLELDPPRLTFLALYQELSASWLKRGFRQTALGLLLAPGVQLREYLRHDRTLLIKPISYLLVVAAFHLWVLSLIGQSKGDIDPVVLGFDSPATADPALLQAVRWLMHHFWQIALVQAALVALSLRFVFYRRSGYSLAEYMIVVIYLLTQSILMQALLTLFYIPFQQPMPGAVHLLIGGVYITFAIGQFHNAAGPAAWVRALASYALAMLVVLGALFALLTIWETQHAVIEDTVKTIEHPAP